jgi:hypothetical protein
MDPSKTKSEQPQLNLPNGIFVRGITVSNRAKAFRRKDGSGLSVVVEHEIALQPGVVIWTRYFDPAKDACVKIEEDTVIEFPKLKELATVTLRAGSIRSDEQTGQLTIKSAELLG